MWSRWCACAAVVLVSACATSDGSVDVGTVDSQVGRPSTTAGDPVNAGTDASESTVSASATVTGDDSNSAESNAACGDAEAAPTSFAYASAEGVDADLLSIDVYGGVDGRACPAVLWIHGGAWLLGDKSTTATRVKAAHFIEQGYVFVSIGYRLVAEDNDVRWPTNALDVAQATSWVIEHAGELGVDPDRVSLVGHSAGAHLVSIVGTNPNLLGDFDRSPDDLACIVSLDTISYDLTTDERRANEPVRATFEDDDAKLLDGSPLLQVRSLPRGVDLADFLVVTRGSRSRLDASREFVDAVTAGGDRAEYFDASPYTHRDVNVELGETGESVVTPIVTDFLNGC